MRVLVTGTSTFFSARIIQELGRQQVEMTAADSLHFSAGKMSRYCRHRMLLPHLNRDPGGYLKTLLDVLRREDFDLLLPTFEESLLLSEHQHEIPRRTRLLLPDFHTMLAVHCKPVLHQRCQVWQIPSPLTWWPADVNEVRSLAQTMAFPVMLKLPMANNSDGRTICRDVSTLLTHYQRLAKLVGNSPAQRPFIQQLIDGELICTLMYCAEGRKHGEVIYRTLRTLPDDGGTSVHRESIPHPQIEALTQQFARQTNWSGFVGLDFLVDRQSGQPHLIDVNPRANPAVNLGFMAGVNWTELILRLANGEQPAPVFAQPGMRTRTVLLDIAWLIEGLSPGPNWLQKSRSRLKRFLRPEWTSHGRDLLSGMEDWQATVALGAHGFVSLLKAGLTGNPIGRIALDDANYDFASAARFSGRDPNCLPEECTPSVPWNKVA